MEGTELPQSERDDGSDPGGETGVPGEEVVPAPDTGGGDEGDDSDGPALQSEPDADPLRPPPPDEPSEGPGPTTAPPSGGTPVSPGDPVTSPPETIVRNHSPAPARGNDERADNPSADKPKAKPRSGVGSAPAANVPPAPPLAAQSAPDASAGPAPRSDPPVPGADAANGTHVVQPGESLWSIAAGLAGDDATPAKIARIVNRLWTLNADRIGTGDPDLVMAGTTLRLR